VVDLEVNLTSGATTAAGPGRMTTVRPKLLPKGVAGKMANAPKPPGEADEDRLRYLNVGFQGSLSGNFRDREMTFRDQVRTIYGPVDSWESTLDPDDPEGPGPDEILMDCNRLKVAEMPVPLEDHRAVELEAEGNVLVEGRSRTFTARAHRVSYDDAKQLLILEGKGWTDATLYLQEHTGTPPSTIPARKILYWISTGQFQLIGPRSLNLNQVPSN
jgi:hypothetical protein